jgi:hypothetical protein
VKNLLYALAPHLKYTDAKADYGWPKGKKEQKPGTDGIGIRIRPKANSRKENYGPERPPAQHDQDEPNLHPNIFQVLFHRGNLSIGWKMVGSLFVKPYSRNKPFFIATYRGNQDTELVCVPKSNSGTSWPRATETKVIPTIAASSITSDSLILQRMVGRSYRRFAFAVKAARFLTAIFTR